MEKIVYITQKDKEIIALPKLSFNLSTTQRSLLNYLEKNEISNYTKLAEIIGISRAMLYNNIKDLVNTGLISETENGIKLTEIGIIAIM
ncbi:MAG: winged helix-turn-helix transcriptional regulator [DPANN group archaeon]|nr:winged helix-turn-helix transcriptional regulator [DPANN group archaeon]